MDTKYEGSAVRVFVEGCDSRPSGIVMQLHYDTGSWMFNVVNETLHYTSFGIQAFRPANRLNVVMEVVCRGQPDFAKGQLYQGNIDLTGWGKWHLSSIVLDR